MKVKSVQKIAITYFYVETDDELFPEYRRSESGQWEHLMGESWESYYNDDQGSLEQAFQYYIAGLPLPPGGFQIQFHNPLLESDVYHIEYIDADHVRLTKIGAQKK